MLKKANSRRYLRDLCRKDCLKDSPPIHLEQKMRNENTDKIVQQYMEKFS
jgi:hypothetical protein